MRVSVSSGHPIFIFSIKENWICAMTRHHAEPSTNILLTKNLCKVVNKTLKLSKKGVLEQTEQNRD